MEHIEGDVSYSLTYNDWTMVEGKTHAQLLSEQITWLVHANACENASCSQSWLDSCSWSSSPEIMDPVVVGVGVAVMAP